MLLEMALFCSDFSGAERDAREKKTEKRHLLLEMAHFQEKAHSVTASSVASCWDSKLAKSSHTVIVQRIKTPLLLVAISIQFRSLAPVLLQLAL